MNTSVLDHLIMALIKRLQKKSCCGICVSKQMFKHIRVYTPTDFSHGSWNYNTVWNLTRIINIKFYQHWLAHIHNSIIVYKCNQSYEQNPPFKQACMKSWSYKHDSYVGCIKPTTHSEDTLPTGSQNVRSLQR